MEAGKTRELLLLAALRAEMVELGLLGRKAARRGSRGRRGGRRRGEPRPRVGADFLAYLSDRLCWEKTGDKRIPYEEFLRQHRSYLKTPRWRSLRLRAIEGAGGRCSACGLQRARLQVHHRTYKRWQNERREDLVVLCHSCYRKSQQERR